ncbi:MarR family winged helix-turn-helix transcriptional regulator [Roseovarius sp. 2305UL8-3]|uniref:MarR family winged helix-turn-helix transcriptional regulator n=1 Tax=Roseovarius conchicola TaxID=3121636 RepID=UPI0035279E21
MQVFSATMGFEKSKSAGYLANHMARLFAAGLQNRIKPLGIAPAQFMVMLELWTQDGLTQRDLVERLDVEQATMANTLARMERDGLIQRRPSPTDKRAKVIVLTDKAKALREPAQKGARAQNETALSGLSKQESEQLISLMQRVIATMQRAPK